MQRARALRVVANPHYPAFRVNAGEIDIASMASTFGARLDPSIRRRDRNIGPSCEDHAPLNRHAA